MFDPVRQPAHYIEGRSIEPIDVIEDWELGFHLGNALKYITRAGRKDPATRRQDISKAIWYLERYQDMHAEEDQQAQDADELMAAKLQELQNEWDEGTRSEFRLELPLTTPGGLRSPQSRRADTMPACGCDPGCDVGCECCTDQEDIEFEAMGELAELGTVKFGSDEDVPFDGTDQIVTFEFEGGHGSFMKPKKDFSKFQEHEVVETYMEGDMILGLQKNGDVRILKHREDLYDQLPADTEPSWPVSDH